MDVLVIEDCPVEGPVLVRLLDGLGHKATLARTSEDALRVLQAHTPDIVVTDMMMPGMSGTDLISHVRALDLDRYVYVIMRTGKDSEQAIQSSFFAGADDFIPKNRTLEELKARVRAGERIVKLEHKLRDRVRELESALRRLDVAASLGTAAAVESVAQEHEGPKPTVDGPLGIAGLNAWRSLPLAFSAVFAQTLQCEFAAAPLLPTTLSGTNAASIKLTDVEHDAEISVTVACEDATLEQITLAVLGEADPEIMKDFLCELANLAMGATKSSFVKEGCVFTGGLPQQLQAPDVNVLLEPYPSRLCLQFTHEDRRFFVLVGSRKSGRVQLRVNQLREGMVLAKDVLGPGDVLLIRAGTRVTETLAERLRKRVPQLIVELAEASATMAAE